MEVDKILFSIRSNYISGFVHELHDLQKEYYVALEPLNLEDSGEITTQGKLDLPSRIDYAVVKDESTENYSFTSSNETVSFDPLKLKSVNDIDLSIYPFLWGHCRCQLLKGPEEADWQYLRQWYLKWFDEGISDEQGFSGCIHSMSDPEKIEQGYQMIIDFGSAPIDVIEDWIETVNLMGFKKVNLGYAN